MKTKLFIFLGSGFGGLARYWISTAIHSFTGRQFPFGTLAVNVTGSILIGILFILIFEKFNMLSQIWKDFILIGFLGGYTTFSAFSIETFNLLESGAYKVAIFNIMLNIILGISATWAGTILGRKLLKITDTILAST